MAIGLTASGCEAHVRLPAAAYERLTAVIDAGVDGIVLPGAEHPDEVRELLARLRYPPGGRRGFGPRRAGGTAGARPEPHVPLTVQVESPEGVSAAGNLAGIDGVDAIVVGCGDFLARARRAWRPRVAAAARRCGFRGRRRGGCRGALRRRSIGRQRAVSARQVPT